MVIQPGLWFDIFTERDRHLACCVERVGPVVTFEIPPQFALRNGVDLSPRRILVLEGDDSRGYAEIVKYEPRAGDQSLLVVRLLP
jgi:hypothetical protein